MEHPQGFIKIRSLAIHLSTYIPGQDQGSVNIYLQAKEALLAYRSQLPALGQGFKHSSHTARSAYNVVNCFGLSLELTEHIEPHAGNWTLCFILKRSQPQSHVFHFPSVNHNLQFVLIP